LIHGAWANGSAWGAVIQRLQADGYHVAAPQLPMSSLDEDVARVRQVLAAQSGPTLLVAHSFGGAVITELSHDAPNVVGLVYESAFAPDEGETMNGLINGGPQPAGVAAIRPDAQGFLWLDPDGLVRFFAPDVDPVQARVMSAVQQPIAASEFMGDAAFGTPSWRSLPSWYLVTENDQMVPPAVQHLFAQRMGANIASVAGSHASMVSHPDEVTAFIAQAAQAASVSARAAAA
jgi:pimeloyl-ACP methyl ester carboxylesterase